MKVFQLELRNTWKSTLIWTAVLSSIIFLLLAFFPSMQTESMKELAGAKMEGLDPKLLEAFGLAELTDFTIITNYFGYVLQYLTLAIMVYVCQSAVLFLVKEETDGTIEFLYSKPISRNAIFTQKALAHIVSYLVMLIVLWLITVIGYLFFSDYDYMESIKEVGAFYSAILYVGFVFMAVGFLLSVCLKNSKGATGVVIAIVFGSFILGIISTVVEALHFLYYVSPMDWIKTQKLMTDGILLEEWVIGLLIIVFCLIAAKEMYKRKDLRL
ncbi:ABC transporter permease subunit [Lysinibacillus sp. LZ02]|uniref:ABC transporter permease subunit n=1 Tax=Lysinibacillus sp. LZ02 TaxID=3420668 RepID=UPI003D35E384